MLLDTTQDLQRAADLIFMAICAALVIVGVVYILRIQQQKKRNNQELDEQDRI